MKQNATKAIILLSGGLDSTVILALALNHGRKCHAITFDYGQRHRVELTAARAVATHYNVPHRIITIDPIAFGNTSLTSNSTTPIPKGRDVAAIVSGATPSTYVPARNALFLAYALGQAEIVDAAEIYAGPNALDAAPYPDCRPEFFEAFQRVADLATCQAAEGNPPRIVTPLISWDKKRIVKEGSALDAPLHLTWSCYDPTADNTPCGLCDACVLRNDAMAP